MSEKTVTDLKPYTMTLFAKSDAEPGFYAVHCRRETLFDAVKEALHGPNAKDSQEIRDEVETCIDTLLERGDDNFEDGWLSLRIGYTDSVAFAIQKAADARADEKWSDGERYKQHLRAEDARDRYEKLREALIDALGPQADTLISLAVQK